MDKVYSRLSLDPEQEQLLADFVEAERQIPREQRQHFIIVGTMGPPGVQLNHKGWRDKDRRVFEGDIDTLASTGLIAKSIIGSHADSFYVTPTGFEYYSELMRRRGQPIERVQTTIRNYLNSSEFQKRYPGAFSKWCQAEEMLWSSDSANAYTTIGHLTREAMQEFVTSLVDRFRPPQVESDRSKTVARLRAVLAARASTLGTTERSFLDALVAYWGTVSDLVQRQEHGALREGLPLSWVDARRVVFQVTVVMYEIDASLAG